MYILDVVPLTKILDPSLQTLTYFSAEKLPLSSVAAVPLHRRTENALVVHCEPIAAQKLTLKKAEFSLRPVIKVITKEPLLFTWQIALARYLAQYYISPLGMIMRLFIPRSIARRKKPFHGPITEPLGHGQKARGGPPKGHSRPILIWGQNRLPCYEKYIRQALKEKKQILYLAPELYEIEEAAKKISAVFPHASHLILKNDFTSSKELQSWHGIKSGAISLVFGNRSAVFLPFFNLGLIIIDGESSDNFKSWDMFPYYDAREICRHLTKILSIPLVLGADLPSLQSWQETHEKITVLIRRKNNPQPKSSEVSIIDMKEELTRGNTGILSIPLLDAVRDHLEKGKRIFLFINRRGSSPIVFCRDCGHAIICAQCQMPVVYHKTNRPAPPSRRFADAKKIMPDSSEFLLCHHCAASFPVPLLCPACKSYRIKFFGTGTQKVADEISRLFPNASVERLDSDSAPTSRDQKAVFDRFLAKEINILVGTQIALKKGLLPNIDLAAVILADPMMRLPDFTIGEKSARIFFSIRAISRRLYIQTYTPSNPIFESVKQDSWDKFFDEEARLRKALRYPPFSKVIKITIGDTQQDESLRKAETLKKSIEQFFNAGNPREMKADETFELQILGPVGAFVPKKKNKWAYHLVLKLWGKKGPPMHHPHFSYFIQSILPKNAVVDVNPESLL